MRNNAEFVVEKDAFRLEADIEEGLDEKWWALAENLLGEKNIKK